MILAKTIQSSLKVNKIRQMQMKSLSDLVDNAGMVNKKTYEKKYNRIGEFSVPYPTANKGIYNYYYRKAKYENGIKSIKNLNTFT